MIVHLRTIDLALNKTKDFELASPEAEKGLVLAITPFKCYLLYGVRERLKRKVVCERPLTLSLYRKPISPKTLNKP